MRLVGRHKLKVSMKSLMALSGMRMISYGIKVTEDQGLFETTLLMICADNDFPALQPYAKQLLKSVNSMAVSNESE